MGSQERQLRVAFRLLSLLLLPITTCVEERIVPIPIFPIPYELYFAGERDLEAQDENEAQVQLLSIDPWDLMTFPQVAIVDIEEVEDGEEA